MIGVLLYYMQYFECNITILAVVYVSLLEEYKKSHVDVGSSYVVSGEGTDGRYCINVCPADQMEGNIFIIINRC
jgi:hypothetical protein